MKEEIKIEEPPKPNKLKNYLAYGALLTAMAGLILFMFLLTSQGSRQQHAIEDETARINQLVEKINQLSEENKKLNETNVNYAYCNAVIVAKYTQTQEPIEIEDLNECILKSFPNASLNGENRLNAPNQNQKPVESSNPNQLQSDNSSSTTLQPQEPNQPQPKPEEPQQPQESILDLFPLLELNPCLDVLVIRAGC